MYSTNGRKRPSDKEKAAKTASFRSTLVCNDCADRQEGKGPVFGEKAKCGICGSTSVYFEYN